MNEDIKQSYNCLPTLSNNDLLKIIIQNLNSYKSLQNLSNTCRTLNTAIKEVKFRIKNLWFYYEYDDCRIIVDKIFCCKIKDLKYRLLVVNSYDSSFLKLAITGCQRPDTNTNLDEEKLDYLDYCVKTNLQRYNALCLKFPTNYELNRISSLKNFHNIKYLYIISSSFSQTILDFIKTNADNLERIVFTHCTIQKADINNQSRICITDVTHSIEICKHLFSYRHLLSMFNDEVKLRNLYLTHGVVDCLESEREFEFLYELSIRTINIHLDIFFEGFRNHPLWLEYFNKIDNLISLKWFFHEILDISIVFQNDDILKVVRNLKNFAIIYDRKSSIIRTGGNFISIPRDLFNTLLNSCTIEIFAFNLSLFEYSNALTDVTIDPATGIEYKNIFYEFCYKLPNNLTTLYLNDCGILSIDEFRIIANRCCNIETLILHGIRDYELCDLNNLASLCKKLKYVDFTIHEKYSSTIILHSLTKEILVNGTKKAILNWPSFDIFTCKFCCPVKGLNVGFKELEINTPRDSGRFIIKVPRKQNENETFYNFPSGYNENFNEIEVTIFRESTFYNQRKYIELKQYIDETAYNKIEMHETKFNV
uniref:F-box domain-containing protein n=1 Tax=Parastrongyloides trichosuri TaxID=131310 RepID=A0A0N5A588_PARTI